MKLFSRACVYITSRRRRSFEPLLGPAELTWAQWWAHRGEAIFFFAIGVILIIAPAEWFGPAWSYFNFIPHRGFGIGVVCLGLGSCLIIGIWLRSKMIISIVLLLGAVSFWVAAFLLAAQGLRGHTGLMEAPFMMYCSVDMLIRSSITRR